MARLIDPSPRGGCRIGPPDFQEWTCFTKVERHCLRKRPVFRLGRAEEVERRMPPDVSTSEVARSAGIHVSQLFRWRKDLCDRVDAGSSQLVPVEIVPAALPSAVETPAPMGVSRSASSRKSGIIEIELGGGRRVRVDRDVDAEAPASASSIAATGVCGPLRPRSRAG